MAGMRPFIGAVEGKIPECPAEWVEVGTKLITLEKDLINAQLKWVHQLQELDKEITEQKHAVGEIEGGAGTGIV